MDLHVLWTLKGTEIDTIDKISGRFSLRTLFLAYRANLIWVCGLAAPRIRYDSFWLWIVSGGSKRCLLNRERQRYAGRSGC